MKYIRRALLAAACLGMLGVPSFYVFANRATKNEVRHTVEGIRLAEAKKTLSAQTITNLAVGAAQIHVGSVVPLEFTVRSMTPWPDLQIYEYDSRTPEKGVYHYSW